MNVFAVYAEIIYSDFVLFDSAWLLQIGLTTIFFFVVVFLAVVVVVVVVVVVAFLLLILFASFVLFSIL